MAANSDKAYRDGIRTFFFEKEMKGLAKIGLFLGVTRGTIGGWFAHGGTTKGRLHAGLAAVYFQQSGVFIPPSSLSHMNPFRKNCLMPQRGHGAMTLAARVAAVARMATPRRRRLRERTTRPMRMAAATSPLKQWSFFCL
jgi:hypothetical protein